MFLHRGFGSSVSSGAGGGSAKPKGRGDDIDDLLEELGGLEGLGGETSSSVAASSSGVKASTNSSARGTDGSPSFSAFEAKSLSHHSSGLGFKTGDAKCVGLWLHCIILPPTASYCLHSVQMFLCVHWWRERYRGHDARHPKAVRHRCFVACFHCMNRGPLVLPTAAAVPI